MAVEEDVQRVMSLLKRAIRSSGMSQKQVDRQIGVQPGYLSQVMIGRLDLKVKHLLRALEAIQVDTKGFFDLAFPEFSRAGARGSDLLDLLPTKVATPAAGGSERVAVSDDELQRLVARALAEELGFSGQDDAPPSFG